MAVLQEQEYEALSFGSRLKREFGAADCDAYAQLMAMGQPQCRELCEAIHDRLPREVRDMIYGHVLDGALCTKRVTITDEASNCTVMNGKFIWYPKPHRCVNGVCTLHCLNTAYVGALMRNEIAEALFKVATYAFKSGWDNLSNLLNSDRWLIGAPAYRFIKWLDIHISLGCGCANCADGDEGRDTCAMEALVLLRPGAHVILHFDFLNCYYHRRHLLRSFKHMLGSVWKYVGLMDARLEVEVRMENHGMPRETALSNDGKAMEGWVQNLEEVSC
jgi:hypothetical protein